MHRNLYRHADLHRLIYTHILEPTVYFWHRAHLVLKYWFLVSFSNKKNRGFLEKMADSWTEARNTQNELEEAYMTIK